MYHYALALRNADFLMVNSSWTKNHIDSILQHSDLLLDVFHVIFWFLPIQKLRGRKALNSARIVYPPCDTREMAEFSLTPREHVILSVAQFRYAACRYRRSNCKSDLKPPFLRFSPEKDHPTQLRAFHQLLQSDPGYTSTGAQSVKLVLVGGSRNDADAQRVKELRNLASELEIEVCGRGISYSNDVLILTSPHCNR